VIGDKATPESVDILLLLLHELTGMQGKGRKGRTKAVKGEE
jgi:hypothetical protein